MQGDVQNGGVECSLRLEVKQQQDAAVSDTDLNTQAGIGIARLHPVHKSECRRRGHC